MRVDEFVKQHEGRISKSLAIATAREAFKKLESKPCIWVASPEFLKQHVSFDTDMLLIFRRTWISNLRYQC